MINGTEMGTEATRSYSVFPDLHPPYIKPSNAEVCVMEDEGDKGGANSSMECCRVVKGGRGRDTKGLPPSIILQHIG